MTASYLRKEVFEGQRYCKYHQTIYMHYFDWFGPYPIHRLSLHYLSPTQWGRFCDDHLAMRLLPLPFLPSGIPCPARWAVPLGIGLRHSPFCLNVWRDIISEKQPISESLFWTVAQKALLLWQKPWGPATSDKAEKRLFPRWNWLTQFLKFSLLCSDRVAR